ncbi:tubulin-tyrosine ligase family-domain-containing protein [Chlamydoabsidia padenii]|nr:tubulin-tyrosine ligase family-domain-containing protein [Chlamydoabsidia padenii]
MASAFESFVAVHQYQLKSIPEDLWQPLFMKLGEDYLDAGSTMELHHGDPLPGYSLHLKNDGSCLEKHSDIYLIDHAWTTTPETAKQQLKDNTINLLERLENLMGIEPEEGWVDEDDEDEQVDHDDAIISMVAEQANVSYEKAKQALVEENYEVVNAIANLTIDPEFKKQADALQDQVLGQLIASGKAQEKEDTVNKEKEEKKERWIADWMDRRVNKVYDTMWSFIQTYSYTVLKTDGQSAAQTALYINDEVGSAISHSPRPNMVCIPFIFSRGASAMIPYSVLFPIRTIQPGELITCDLLPKTLGRDVDRHAYLYAIEDRVDPAERVDGKMQRDMIMDAFKVYQNNNNNNNKNDDQPITNREAYHQTLCTTSYDSSTVKIYTDMDDIRSDVTLPHVQWVNDRHHADLIYTKNDDSTLTYPHNLAPLIRATFGVTAPWYLSTYSLSNELAECVGDYLNQSEPTLWTIQSYDNTSRRILSSLPELIRQYDTPMTPQLAQHYPHHPCLYNGKKFHLRYLVLLNRLQDALFAGVYNKMFWVRLANKKYSVDDTRDMERHLLVDSGFEMTRLDHASFIRHMEKEHSSLEWTTVQTNINNVIKDVVYAITADKERSPSGAFMFDIMLKDTFQPVVMDVQPANDQSFYVYL